MNAAGHASVVIAAGIPIASDATVVGVISVAIMAGSGTRGRYGSPPARNLAQMGPRRPPSMPIFGVSIIEGEQFDEAQQSKFDKVKFDSWRSRRFQVLKT